MRHKGVEEETIRDKTCKSITYLSMIRDRIYSGRGKYSRINQIDKTLFNDFDEIDTPQHNQTISIRYIKASEEKHNLRKNGTNMRVCNT